jgi:hypothetical protein
LAKQVRRSKDDKRQDLVKIRDAGEEVMALASHPEVQAYFADMKKRLTTAVFACPVNDDDGRRAIALQMNALLQFQQQIGFLVGNGDAARNQLASMKDDDNG